MPTQRTMAFPLGYSVRALIISRTSRLVDGRNNKTALRTNSLQVGSLPTRRRYSGIDPYNHPIDARHCRGSETKYAISENYGGWVVLGGVFVFVLLMTMVPIVGGLLHAHRERQLLHAERMKALELGIVLPENATSAPKDRLRRVVSC